MTIFAAAALALVWLGFNRRRRSAQPVTAH